MWKDINVVMLPTNEKAINKNQIVFNKEINNLYISNEDIICKEDWNKLCTPHLISPQHLYFLSDEEIKEGDWCYDTKNNRIFIAKSSYEGMQYIKKIIATTDRLVIGQKELAFPCEENDFFGEYEDIYLPQPSQQFIEKYIEEYNKGNIITEVKVHYEDIYSDFDSIEPSQM